MLLYGWSQIPFVYLLSFAFNLASKGYSMIVVYSIITGKQESLLNKIV